MSQFEALLYPNILGPYSKHSLLLSFWTLSIVRNSTILKQPFRMYPIVKTTNFTQISEVNAILQLELLMVGIME
jgi:hypothetical protein